LPAARARIRHAGSDRLPAGEKGQIEAWTLVTTRGARASHSSHTGAAPSPSDWRSDYRALRADRTRDSSGRNRAKSGMRTRMTRAIDLHPDRA
jgi:hypothetical protein